MRSSWTGKPIMKSNTNRLGNFADLIPFFPWQTATYHVRKFFKKIKQNASWTLKSLIILNGLDLLILLRIFKVFVPLEIFKIHHEYLLNYWNLLIPCPQDNSFSIPRIPQVLLSIRENRIFFQSKIYFIQQIFYCRSFYRGSTLD